MSQTKRTDDGQCHTVLKMMLRIRIVSQLERKVNMIQLKAMWEPGFSALYKNKDPQVIAEEIYSISDEPTKEQIVDKARDENSELHDLFEWDDSVAAEKYRGFQANKLLSVLKVTFINDTAEDEPSMKVMEPVRMFYGNPSGGEGFVSIVKIMGNKDMYAQLLERARAELQSFKKKYNILKELEPIFEMIDNLK